jgi:hypothetical protein
MPGAELAHICLITIPSINTEFSIIFKANSVNIVTEQLKIENLVDNGLNHTEHYLYIKQQIKYFIKINIKYNL